MKKIILAIVMVLGFISSVSASSKSGCVLAQKGKITVAWTAYKTASKIGVSGTFDKVDYKAVAKDGKNFREILVGSSVNIDTSSVNSKNTGRDVKLVKFFFKQMDSNTMNAKITDIKADKKLKDKARTGVVTLDFLE
jgi:hypothetical protein